MKRNNLLLLLLGSAVIVACNSGNSSSSTPTYSPAYYQQLCSTAGGYFQYGIVNSPPSSDYPNVTNYRAGSESIDGIPLSHTHIEITSAVDGNIYDVAIDNVFAADYNNESYNVFSNQVPASYSNNLTAGSLVYMCSGNPSRVPYSVSGESFAVQGFDWVHTNCVASGYASTYKNGWLYDSHNNNLTNNQSYCYLWPN